MRRSAAPSISPNDARLGFAWVTEPAVVPPLVTPAALYEKFVWLKVLKNSARNCIPKRSVNGKFLTADISQSQNPGPMNWPLPTLPGVPTAGSEKADLLSHWRHAAVVPLQAPF